MLKSERVVAADTLGIQVNRSLDNQKLVCVILPYQPQDCRITEHWAIGAGERSPSTPTVDVDCAFGLAHLCMDTAAAVDDTANVSRTISPDSLECLRCAYALPFSSYQSCGHTSSSFDSWIVGYEVYRRNLKMRTCRFCLMYVSVIAVMSRYQQTNA